MNIKFLLLGTSLSFLPTLSLAQCVATQDCATLGYTETSCNGGKGVKCPFGNKWVCFKTDEECIRLACEQLDFRYSCTGTGYAGGAGSACGGKYAYCTCAEGYEWKDGSCQKEVLNGAQGDAYYCNGTLVAVKMPEMDFYVGMKDLGFMYWSDANSACLNYSFCGTLKGALPSREQLLTIYNNKSSLNTLLSTSGGKKFSTDDYYWSSTIRSSSSTPHFIVHMSDGRTRWSGPFADLYVRPVLASY